MDNSQKLKEEVRDIFTDYLAIHKLSQTKERYILLDFIYSSFDFFNIESLNQTLIDSKIYISRATIYNTMELLMQCGLVVHHQFGNNDPVYECTYSNNHHNNIICIVCGSVQRVDGLGDVFHPSMKRKIRKFKVGFYRLHLYGICSKCEFKRRLAVTKLKREREKANAAKNQDTTDQQKTRNTKIK